MIYECEQCEAVLGPGIISCPRCGQIFDEPVPLDALPEAGEASVTPSPTVHPSMGPRAAQRPSRRPNIALSLAGLLILACAGWIGYRYVLPASQPLSTVATSTAMMPSNPLPTDVAAHPGYAADMMTFVGKLRASGVQAQWPAFGSNDTLLITPQTMVNGQRAEWNADLYHALAQGVYGNFVFRRYESKFSDTDSTTCFVIVSDSSGKVVAADLMGNLE